MDPSQLKTLPDANLPAVSPLEALLERPVGSGKTREQENKTGLPTRPDTGRLPVPCPPMKEKLSFSDLKPSRFTAMFDEAVGVTENFVTVTRKTPQTTRFEILPGHFVEVDNATLYYERESVMRRLAEQKMQPQRRQLQRDTDQMLNSLISIYPAERAEPRSGRRMCYCNDPRCCIGPFTGNFLPNR